MKNNEHLVLEAKVCAGRETPFSRMGGRDGNAQITGRESTGKQTKSPIFLFFFFFP
jgi:hypothetical protein